jgi:hypothetical protein
MPVASISCNQPHQYRKPKEDVYAIAVDRSNRSRGKSDYHDDIYLYRYERARRVKNIIQERHSRVQEELLKELYNNVKRWKSETKHWSSMAKRIAHPSYLRIIGLSRGLTNHEVERVLLQELQKKPSHWFAALSAITGENPIRPEHTFDEAVAAWIAWGRKQGII